MTEDEAKTRWCPYAHAAPSMSTAPHCNRYSNKADLPAGTSCIASGCMAWRALPDNSSVAGKITEIKAYRTLHNCDLRAAKDAVEAYWKPGEPSGYCGLAGAPA